MAHSDRSILKLHRRTATTFVGFFSAIVLCSIFALPQIVHAGSAVGGGGSGGGGGGGHQSSYGYGWYKYGVNGGGPKDGFRDGTKWSSVQKTCKNAGADLVIGFIVLNASKDAMVYKWEGWTNVKSGGNYISIKTAKSYYDEVDSSAKKGFTWGKNVAWFCYNSTGPYKITPKTTVSTATQSGNSITAKLGEKVTFHLKIDASGSGNPPTVKWGYGDNDSGGKGIFNDDKSKWSDNMGSMGSRSQDIDLPNGAVAGNTYCLSTYVNPHANTDFTIFPDAGHKPPANDIACVTIESSGPGPTCLPLSLSGMTLMKSGSYDPAIKLTNVASIPAFSYRIYKQGAVVPAYTTVTPSATGTAPNQTISATVTYTPATPGTYIMQWQVAGMASPCPASTIVGYQPYFQVYGGDIIAGIAFPMDGAPADASSQVIASWDSESPDYNGAKGNLAVIASGTITQFSAGGDSANPSKLAFANTAANVNIAAGKYGGGFGAFSTTPDYMADVRAGAGSKIHPCPGNTFSLNGLESGVYDCLHSVTITGGLVDGGKNITVIVEGGSVFIAGDITYSYNGLTDIPRLNMLTNGNIVVASSVKEIHAVLVAQGKAKKFYSCGGSATDGYEYANIAAHSECSTNTLTVYGSVTAGELVLGRTAGSWMTNDPPAENFVYSPETWLSQPYVPDGSHIRLDSYISLPPVL